MMVSQAFGPYQQSTCIALSCTMVMLQSLSFLQDKQLPGDYQIAVDYILLLGGSSQ